MVRRVPSASEGRAVAPSKTGERVIMVDRPLGAALEFLRALWGVNHGLESKSRRMKTRLGVTGPERMVVRLVGRYPEISAGQLARILQVHPSTLTGLLRRLVERSVLVRGSDSGDGRRALFSLTKRGRRLDVAKDGTVEAAVGSTLQSLSPRDVRVTVAVLEALKRKLQPVDTL
jgi:MarR family transcriptional regulator, organic hydroperoxide resistance regulator